MNAILYITSLSDWFSSFLNDNECVRMCVCVMESNMWIHFS